MSLRIRFLVLALFLMMVSSCLATNRKTMMVDGKEKEKRQLLVENEKETFENFETAMNHQYHVTIGAPKGDPNPHQRQNSDSDGKV
ncbi:hypothetical protein RHGRI_036538 [Rhododendron griersonianum]|uniref:Uncharacterized protein n=1 Tax=Rhododendron griersonianum TaxID=479676 RepID=A0AAV6HRH0_9ERIC|nr:hypothetical protein RHGRI_036536 [Rhododendron griersonianum]KAG5515531.1 hypothetical protein RHGRI_036538 [Rhododendron griersonianum]